MAANPAGETPALPRVSERLHFFAIAKSLPLIIVAYPTRKRTKEYLDAATVFSGA